MIRLFIEVLFVSFPFYELLQNPVKPTDVNTNTQNIEIIYKLEARPTVGEKKGTFKIKPHSKSGFCGVTEVLELAKTKASETGGNAIYVTQINSPVDIQYCYSIKVDVYNLDEPYVSVPNKDLPATFKPGKVEHDYNSQEIMPSFPGGDAALLRYLYTHLNYPVTAVRDNVEGKVKISFIVDETGKIKDIKIDNGVSNEIDQEATRLISSMPEWVPGYQTGKAVPVKMTIPINFNLAAKY